MSVMLPRNRGICICEKSEDLFSKDRAHKKPRIETVGCLTHIIETNYISERGEAREEARFFIFERTTAVPESRREPVIILFPTPCEI